MKIRACSLMLAILLLIAAPSFALDKSKLSNPSGFTVTTSGDTKRYEPEIDSENQFQLFKDDSCFVHLVPCLLYIPDDKVASCVLYFHLYAINVVPKPNMKVSINANGSRFTMKPAGQSVNIYSNEEDRVVYHLIGTVPIGNKGKKMLKDISLAAGPVRITYELTLDGKNRMFSDDMIDYDRQRITMLRDLYVSCGAVNEDVSYVDSYTSFTSESSK